MAEKSLNLNQTRFLQPLRSNTVHSTYQAAIEDIAAIQNSLASTSHSDGISVVARFRDENGVGKSVLGIYSYVTNSFTYFVHDVESIEKIIERVGSLEEAVGEGGSVTTQITNAIKDLDSTATSTDGTFITISVTQEDGKLKSASVDESALNTKFDEINTAINEAVAAEESARTAADDALSDRIDEVVKDAKSYSIVPITEGLETNVKEAYQLQETVDGVSEKVGSIIKIYKDSSLKEVKLDNQELQFTYILADGSESTVDVDVSNFLAESEFGNGLQVSEAGEVSVKIDGASDSFLTVGEGGVKLSGVQDTINNAVAAEESARTAADDALSERIKAIEDDKTFVKEITVNGVDAAVANNKATVTIEGDNIAVSSGYGDAVTYPTLSNTAVTFTAVKGSDTVDAAIKQLDQNVATLVQEVLNNEEVTAAALTKHNESCGFNENAEYVANTAATYINNASNLVEADNLLDAAISNLQTQIDDVSDAAISVVSGNGISITGESTEKTIAAVANKNDSLITVTENGIGIKDDGYIDCGTF